MTQRDDIGGALANLLQNCRTGLDVDAGGILVESADLHRLELLAASGHETAELEIHQTHVGEGPCVEAYERGVAVHEHSRDALVERWPLFAATMLAAGFTAVHATPLLLEGSPFGAMGLFRRAAVEFTPQEAAVARAFADITTMLVVHLGPVSSDELSARLREALMARILLEQAKGVLAESHSMSMAEAYEVLVHGAREHDRTLNDWARGVVDGVQAAR